MSDIAINRPRGDSVRLKCKRRPVFMEDGSVNAECLDEKGRKVWVAITPVMLQRMIDAWLRPRKPE